MKITWQGWSQISTIDAMSYICGFCGSHTGTDHGFFYRTSSAARIYMCTFCGCPTFFFEGGQFPGPLLGRNIAGLPQDINIIYQEVRDSIKVNNYTAAELLGRKLIMHLAVDVAKASEGLTFVEYIQHLKDAGYIPPNGEKWLDYIRKLGNEKNHEIKVGTKENSEKLLKFVEVLLIVIYEFSAEIDQGDTVLSK